MNPTNYGDTKCAKCGHFMRDHQTNNTLGEICVLCFENGDTCERTLAESDALRDRFYGRTPAICETCMDALDPTSCLTLEDHGCERETCACRCRQ